MDDYNEATVAWAQGFDKCWRCRKRGLFPFDLQIHHFVRGTLRRKNNRQTMAILCPDCHDAEHRGNALGLLGMLALKQVWDDYNYDLAAVCRLRRRAPGSITQAEVDEARKRLVNELLIQQR